MSFVLSFPSDPSSHTDGSHISSGRYGRRVAALASKYPNLRYPDIHCPNYKSPPKSGTLGKVVMLDFQEEQAPVRTDFGGVTHLKNFFQSSCKEHQAGTVRRLYMIEAWDPELIGVLGEHFQISPAILVRQQRAAIWEKVHTSGNTPWLSSTFDPKQSFSITYYEPRYFVPQAGLPDSLKWRCAETRRHISRSRVLHEIDNVGMVHRKASYWSTKSSDGGWDG